MDMRFGTWNVKGLCEVTSLETVASELVKCNFDTVAVQEVIWVQVVSLPADDYTFLYGSGNANHHLGTGFLIHKGIISSVKRVEFISHRMSYLSLRVLCYDIIVLDVHAQTEDKSVNLKDSLYEELERVVDQLPK
jgi:exonuclease III